MIMVLLDEPCLQLHLRKAATAAQKTQTNAHASFYHDAKTQLAKDGWRSSSAYISLLERAIKLRSLPEGKLIHSHINETGFVADRFLLNKLVDMYIKCKSLADARRVFDEMPKRDDFSWNVIIRAYTRQGITGEALALLHQMQQTGIEPNHITFASVLPSCVDLAALEQVHDRIIKSGFQSDVFVESALVDMYAKCGRIQNARDIFDKMRQRDVVSWAVMIAGYAQNGFAEDALKLYQRMKVEGVKPNLKIFTSLLPACANLAALEQGREIHEEIIRSGFKPDLFVENALVDMYAKCGNIEKAREVFNKMHQRDVVSWTAMIAGYSIHGCGKEALGLFQQMENSGTKPNHVTLLCIMSVCSHVGLVDKGLEYFDCMSRDYQMTPAMEHYRCVVDLLGRAGRLDEAHGFINRMPIKPDAAVWRCLLGACRIHNNIELGERTAARLLELEPENEAPYVLLSNIYASAGRWDDREKMRKMMEDRGVTKTPGCSWIEVNKQVHAFLGGDRSHPQTEQIFTELNRLCKKMKAAGYAPDTSFVLNDVEEEHKEQILLHHSEKLAIAYGLLNTSPGTTIRIIKNLRICGDCHSAIKFISKIVGRDIVVRDANRYHHFNDEHCSCGDFW